MPSSCKLPNQHPELLLNSIKGENVKVCALEVAFPMVGDLTFCCLFEAGQVGQVAAADINVTSRWHQNAEDPGVATLAEQF